MVFVNHATAVRFQLEGIRPVPTVLSLHIHRMLEHQLAWPVQIVPIAMLLREHVHLVRLVMVIHLLEEAEAHVHNVLRVRHLSEATRRAWLVHPTHTPVPEQHHVPLVVHVLHARRPLASV